MTWYVQIESYSCDVRRSDKKIYDPYSTVWAFATEEEAADFLRKAARLPFKAVSLMKWSDENEN